MNQKFPNLVNGLISGATALTLALVMMAGDAHAAKKKRRKKRLRAKTSQVTAVKKSDILEKIGADYYGYFYGPPVDNIGSDFGGEGGREQSPINLYNSTRLTYKVGDASKAFVAARFMLNAPNTYSSADAQGNISTTSNDAFGWLDPRIGYQVNGLIKDNGFKISPIIDLELPLTQNSQSKKRIIAPRLFLTTTYDVPDTRITLGGFAGIRYFIMSSNAPAGSTNTWTYFAPFATVQMAPTLSGRVLLEMESSFEDRPVPGIEGEAATLISAPTNLQPALLWNVTPSVEFAPYLKFYTSNFQNTSLGFELSATIL